MTIAMTSRELNVRNNKFAHVKICIFLEFEYGSSTNTRVSSFPEYEKKNTMW